MDIPQKPIGPDNQTQKRWEHNALRRRMLQGTWEQDLEDELLRHLPTDRRESWGPSDLSSNPFEQVTRQLAVLYADTPNVTHEAADIESLINRDGLITLAGLWPMMQRAQQLTLGIRETILKIDISDDGLQFRIVTPDYVYLESSPSAPDQPLYYRELRLRVDAMGRPKWIADVLDIRDPNNPSFSLHEVAPSGELGEDVSKEYMGSSARIGLGDGGYPYIDAQGAPYLPLVVYRAEKTGLLWNSYDQSSLCYGSLTAATLFSFWVHCVKDSSWPQRYIAGLSVAGLSGLDQDMASRRSAVSTDPTSVLVFFQDPDTTTQPLIGQFQPGSDPEKLMTAIASYEYRVATAGGISPAEISRTSGDPRSGYALTVSRQGQREAQRKYAPIFRLYDEELLAKSAKMANRFLGFNLPELGYRVSYQSLPLSPAETAAMREDVVGKLAAGLISPVDAIRILNPDMDDTEARVELIKIRRERAEFGITS